MAIEAPLDVARELYRGEPAEFVAARDRHVAQARRDGDEQRAEAIRALRKPTTAAWAVNRLAVEDADAVAELIEVGDGLRTAQRELRGDEIRRLDRRRDELVRRLLDRAGQLVKGSGRGFGEQVRRQVESTLSAAVAEPDSAQQVREGVLSSALEYSGFGLDELSAAAVRRSGAGSQRPRRKRGSARRGAESGGRARRKTEQSEREPQRAADRRSTEQPDRAEGDRADSRRAGTKSGPRAHRRNAERSEAEAEPAADSPSSSATRPGRKRTGRSRRSTAKRSRSAAEDADSAAARLQQAETELDQAEQQREEQQRRRDELRRELDDLGTQLRETDRRVSRARRDRNAARRRYDAARG